MRQAIGAALKAAKITFEISLRRRMNIVIYNFEQPDYVKRNGGGVSVYSANLIKGLLEDGHTVTFLSSGEQYDVFKSCSAPFPKGRRTF